MIFPIVHNHHFEQVPYLILLSPQVPVSCQIINNDLKSREVFLDIAAVVNKSYRAVPMIVLTPESET